VKTRLALLVAASIMLVGLVIAVQVNADSMQPKPALNPGTASPSQSSASQSRFIHDDELNQKPRQVQLAGRCTLTTAGNLTGYCIGPSFGVCVSQYDATNCPPGARAKGTTLFYCPPGNKRVDATRTCNP
jgi:hypothetical protein